MEKTTICVGMVGSGYAAHLHGNGYEKISRIQVRLKTICDIDPIRAEAVRDRYGFETICTDYHEMLNDPEIDVIDIVTPPVLHPDIAADALKMCIRDRPETALISDYPPFINELVASNMGVALLPQLTWLYAREKNIRFLRIQDVEMFRYINIQWRTAGYLSRAAEIFIRHITDYFQNLELPE